MNDYIKRRDFIKKFSGLFGAGIGLNTIANTITPNNLGINRLKKKNPNPAQRPKVALIKGNDRKANMFEALKLIEDEIKKSIGNKQIVIKPNFTRVEKKDWLASTHVDNIWALLEFLEPFYKNKIIIAEGTGTGDPLEVPLKNYGYKKLAEKYNVEFYDLNNDQYTALYMLDRNTHPLLIPTSNLLLDPNTYLISASVMKTHGYALVTLSLKNIVLAAPMNFGKDNNYRAKMHEEPFHENPRFFNYNMFRMSQYVSPDLAIIDGFVGMEGDGPLFGNLIEVGVAVASTDFVAADRVGVEIMEHDFNNIGHLVYCADAKMGEGDITKIDVVGEKITNCKKKFKPHKDWEKSIRWK